MTSIESTFLGAVKRGPVLILDNMRDKTHAGTSDPITKFSPLIRLSILAVELGADPERILFNDDSVNGPGAAGVGGYEAAIYALQPFSDRMARMQSRGVPAFGFHYCELNSAFFLDEFVIFAERVPASRAKNGNEAVRESLAWLDPVSAAVNVRDAKHIRVLERIKAHFEQKGWFTAADRLAKAMEPEVVSAQSQPDPAYIGETTAKYETAFTPAPISASPAVDRDMTSQLDRTESTEVSLADIVFFCRHTHQPIEMVRSWTPKKFEQHMAALVATLEREGWNTPKASTVLIDARGADPETVIAGFNNPVGQRFEPGTPEAAAHPERVLPTDAEVAGGPNLVGQLQHVINRCSAENGSNTPDFILAELLVEQLAAFNRAVRKRAEWYGRMDEPGRPWTLIPNDELKALADAVREHLPAGETVGLNAALIAQAARILRGGDRAWTNARKVVAKYVEENISLARQLAEVKDPEVLARLQADSALLARIRDLLHERYLRLIIRDKDAQPDLVDVVRGLINDAHVPSVDARDMAALRARAEAAEAGISKLQVRVEMAEAVVERARKSAACREVLGLDPSAT